MCRRPGGGSAHDPPGASRWRLGRFTSYLLVTQSKSDPTTSWRDSPTRKPDSKMKGDNKRYIMCCNTHMCIFVQSRKRKVSDAKGIKSTSSRENLRGGPQHHPGVHLAALQLPPNQTHCWRNKTLFSSNPDLQTSFRFTLDWWSFLPWLSFPPFWLFFAYFPSFENSKCLVIGKHWFQSRIISALTFTQTFTFFLFCWRFF